jgi:hypothetical protein
MILRGEAAKQPIGVMEGRPGGAASKKIPNPVLRTRLSTARLAPSPGSGVLAFHSFRLSDWPSTSCTETIIGFSFAPWNTNSKSPLFSISSRNSPN